ncbi:MAG: hypothetical protein CBB69_001485 [Phycisphaera sp. TMED9]|nr:MAG: hypothetical protein CBB69_001485 [Phycisphaera sp. TMED9]
MSSSLRVRRKSATFVWDMVRDDMTLLAYPFIRIAAGIVLLIAMWSLIFDMPAMQVGDTLRDAGGAMLAESGQTKAEDASMTPQDQKVQKEIGVLFDHTHFGYLILFFIINALIGVISIGAVNAAGLAIARNDRRGLAYGYTQALLRLPQLLGWWAVTMVVGVVLGMLERIRFAGPIIAILVGAAWSVLTFFSITAIMATGVNPISAVGRSKKTIGDCIHKARGTQTDVDWRTLRIGLRAGGPLLMISSLLAIGCIVMLFLDIKFIHDGSPAVTAGIFGAFVVVMIVNGAFLAALGAVLKSVLYVWAEEGSVPEGVKEDDFESAFVNGGMAAKMLGT